MKTGTDCGYPEQIRNENEYVEVNHNTYCLDVANRSMTWWWLVFPQKNESLKLEGLTPPGFHADTSEV
ncbi:hypothetical protein NXW50_30975 [Bacteroides thetaiotaomicron]|nr:hypothetical protein [Bacteroides thetaiotaomicron]MCS2282389.1 hypothetical protein [Bacteroides thetaiotaomicron]